MIREATPADAPALAGVQLRAWHRAYTDWIEPERFGGLEERVARWQVLLGPDRPRRTTLLADLEGMVAGFASVGPAGDADVRGTAGELHALYVDPVAQGAGVGRALLAAADERLRAGGHTEAVLWVFTANGMARDLYERRGWVLEPEAVIRAQHGEDWWAPALRYRRAL